MQTLTDDSRKIPQAATLVEAGVAGREPSSAAQSRSLRVESHPGVRQGYARRLKTLPQALLLAVVVALDCLRWAPGPPGAMAAGVPPSRPSVQVTGLAALDESTVMTVIGRPPRGERRWARWTRAARGRVVQLYRKKGFRIARAWYRVDFHRRVLRIHVDEGRIDRIEIRGAGLVTRLVARAEFALPHGVYHRQTVTRAMKRLRAIPALEDAYLRVVTIRELTATPGGLLVPKRILRVFAVSKEPLGLQLALELSPRFGLGPSLGYAHPSLLATRDRLAVDIGFAVPTRRYYYEASVSPRWVAGHLGLRYRVHPSDRSDLAFGVATEVSGLRDSRRDAGYRNVLDLSWRGELQLIHIGTGPLMVHTGLGAEMEMGLVRLPDPSRARADAPLRRWRLQWSTRLEIDARPKGSPSDDANRIWLDTQLSVSPRGEVSGRIGAGGKLVVSEGAHQFRGAFDGFTTIGTAHFQDMEPVAGPLQRAYFGGRFWTHRMVRLELAYRARLNRSMRIGLVHDLSLFEERATGQRRAMLINGLGPTAHLTFVGLISVEVAYVFGFVLFPALRPLQWSHNLNFRLGTVF